MTTVGILALQGAFREHRRAFARLGVDAREVRLPRHLKDLDGLVIPGGESTTMGKLMVSYELDRAIIDFHRGGGHVWGTCAGAILVAREVLGRSDPPYLNLIDVVVARNAYGRQIASFEADLDVAGLERPFRGVFIRAPRIVHVGIDVNVLASHDGHAVAVEGERVVATVFHPELSRDDRLHRRFLDRIVGSTPAAATPSPGPT